MSATGGALVAARVDRDVVRVTGPDAVAYLQGQLSQDVAAIAAGSSARSFVLQPTGKVDAWLRVHRVGDDELVLDVDAGWGDALLARLQRFKLRVDAELAPEAGWSLVAVRGPGAAALDPSSCGAVVAAPAGWPGVEGIDLLGPDVTAPAGATDVGADGYEGVRIAAGVPAMGAELTERTIPAEAGAWVVAESVSFTKGCFTGQELVARIDSRGGHVPRQVRGVVLEGEELAPVGAQVRVGDDGVGTVTSVGRRLDDGAPIALALIARAVEPPVRATVTDEAGFLATATVADLPLG